MSRSVPAAAFAPVLHSIVSWNCETAASYVSIQGNKLSNYFDVKQPPLKSFRTVLRQHAFPSFLCLQEVRGKADDKDYIAALRHSANDGQRAEEPYYRAYFSLCQIKGPKRFGVATYFREDVTVSKAREVDWDAEGRVLILEMPDFALVNVYALNGSEAVWKDKNGIVKGTRNERKRAFNKLLMQECLEMQQRGLRYEHS
jgi:exonuclease III